MWIPDVPDTGERFAAPRSGWLAAGVVVTVEGVFLPVRAAARSRPVSLLHATRLLERPLHGSRALVGALPRQRWVLAQDGDQPLDDLPEPGWTATSADPWDVRAAMLALDLAPEACVGITATPRGVDDLRAAGCTVIALATEHDLHALAGADHVVPDAAALQIDATATGVAIRVNRRSVH